MGKLNLIQGKWDGKVGKLVGAKWKNKATVRSYAVPSNPNTDAQQTVRGVFKSLTSFVALFSDQIKYLTSLDTRGQSVRNAIIKANKAMIDAGSFTKSSLIVNKGGLPNVSGFTLGTLSAGANPTATFTAPVATNITAKAKIVVVGVDEDNKIAGVGEALLSTGSVTVNMTPVADSTIEFYYWVIDFRGTARVGSINGNVKGTIA